MTVNIMKQYINLTTKQINSYMKIVFGNKFNKKYCDSYTQSYLSMRYNNLDDNNTNLTARKNILEKLKRTQDDLEISNIEDRDMIENMRVFFYYILYFDNVVHYKDLYKKIQKIERLRKKILGKEDESFVDKLYENVLFYIEEKQKLLKKFDTDVFFLKFSNYEDSQEAYRVNLKYNIKFSEEFSNYAIERAFNQGIINEDRLLVEYYLTTIHVMKDILKANFKKQYILEFNHKLLKKSKKLKSLLNIIDNGIIQEKVSLKIRYEYFLENKEMVFELMQQGYRFTIILDNSFEANYKNIEDLNMFKYVIINRNIKNYEEVMEYKKDLSNVLRI